jgi:hypothetical protein
MCRAPLGNDGYVTVVRSVWAYCPAGVEGRHVWRQIQPTTFATLALIGTTPPTFVSDDVVEDTIEIFAPISTEASRRRACQQTS